MVVDGMAQARKMSLRAVIKKDSEEEAYTAALKGKDEKLVRQVAELTLLDYGHQLLTALEGSGLLKLVVEAGPAGVVSAYPPSQYPAEVKAYPDRRQQEVKRLVAATSSKITPRCRRFTTNWLYACLSQREQTSTLIGSDAQDGSLTHWLSSVF